MEARALQPFGAELELDASRFLSADARAELQRLFLFHHLLVLRRQDLSWEQQADFVEALGPVVRNGAEPDQISVDGDASGLGRVPLSYHSDLAFCQAPLRGISLFAVDVIDGATSTRFANAVAAGRRLPIGLRARLEGRRARHVLGRNSDGRNHEPFAEMLATEHPVLMTHPSSGDEILFVSHQQTDRIIGLDPDESETLLETLFADLYDPVHVYEHRWSRGDLIVWDNLALQHARDDLKDARTRVLQRVTLAERGVFDLFPTLRAS